MEKQTVYVYNFCTEDNLRNLKGKPAIIKGECNMNRQYVVDFIDDKGNKTGKWCKVGMTEGVPYSRKFFLKKLDDERAEEIVERYFKEHETNVLTKKQVFLVTYQEVDMRDLIFGVFSSIEKAIEAIKERNPDLEVITSIREINTIKVALVKKTMTGRNKPHFDDVGKNYWITSMTIDKEVF